SLLDVRAIQLAKAALRAGAETLLGRWGAALPDQVVLAGAFGSYIDKHHALACPVSELTRHFSEMRQG
ncbi:MAG: DUF4445 domain-containing protein, partial [Thermoleophilia bacterium]|nr:DUF4445 domain-containing protein [Thermoleophilia bacterium]